MLSADLTNFLFYLICHAMAKHQKGIRMGFKLDIVWYGSKTILLFAVTALDVRGWTLTHSN